MNRIVSGMMSELDNRNSYEVLISFCLKSSEIPSVCNF